MKRFLRHISAVLALAAAASTANANANVHAATAQTAQTAIRVNLVGYLPGDIKVAVAVTAANGSEPGNGCSTYGWGEQTGEQTGEQSSGQSPSFEVRSAETGKVVLRGKGVWADGTKWGLQSAYRLDFSKLTQEGRYYITQGGATSPTFTISASSYDGLADRLLTYMRQQRCGFNPYTGEECHRKDGYITGHPTRNGELIDVTGGWHDAADYLQYQTTSATAAYQMAFAYLHTADKSIFRDNFDSLGLAGANGIPDIVDEIKWGLDWLDKMNPAPGEMYVQIADDRDHCGFRHPADDNADYGYGPGEGRVVYYLSGQPQQCKDGLNRTTGVSSAAGKFASTFALGAEAIEAFYPEFAAKIRAKVQPAWDYALELPGNTQTACVVSPYFYEEDSWTDDVELAAATLYSITGDSGWMQKAAYWGELEPVSPWMAQGYGYGRQYHHYQWYPFINLGHCLLASSPDEAVSAEFSGYMKAGLECLEQRAGDDPFRHGVPYLWCSNNLTSAAATYAHLYAEATGDPSYAGMETALRDWLLGCNPWGTTMICGVPATSSAKEGCDRPENPHSSYTWLGEGPVVGGLVDGPIYRSLFEERAGGVVEPGTDELEAWNGGIAVYHDLIGDYASNEPTMDGTAGLIYLLAAMEESGRAQR